MKEELAIPTLADAGLPEYATEEAAGADVRAHLAEPLMIAPGKSAMVPTGIKCAIPSGYEIQVRPRSGLAYKHQITVLNTPGTIDSDYRGEIKIILINHGNDTFIVEPGMRIAQLVVAPVMKGCFIRATELVGSARGGNGIGSTGV